MNCYLYICKFFASVFHEVKTKQNGGLLQRKKNKVCA